MSPVQNLEIPNALRSVEQSLTPKDQTPPGAAVPAPPCQRLFGGLFVRRERWSLSRRGKLIALVVVICTFAVVQRAIHPFLAVTKPMHAAILVVDGSALPYSFRQTAQEYRRRGYQRVLVVKGVYEKEDLAESNWSSVDYAAGLLLKEGMPKDRVDKMSFLITRKDRTYHSALAVKKWFAEQGNAVKSIDVATLGAHARRSRLLYQKAFGDDAKVGIIAMTSQTYDPDHWWRSSEGVREVLGESIAYLYARFFFSPQ